jgi:exodeoxyribonuclease VII large subunit
VTSPSGAVIRDILHRLRDRFPRRVLVWPVAVQGEKCAGEVSRAIAGFNEMTPGGALPRPDVLIVARGGGSLEDLWGFNEEVVARAAAASDIPLVSAVGHETDTTLIDFVSDKRAPTPTAAAELAVPVRHEILAWVDQQGARLSNALSQSLGQRSQRVRDLSRAMPRIEALLDNPRQRLDLWGDRLPAALRHLVQRRKTILVERVGTLRPSFLRTRIESETRRLGSLAPRLQPALSRGVAQDRNRFATLNTRLRSDILERDIQQKRRVFSDVSRRFAQITSSEVAARRERLDALDRLRETLGYKETLRRGYAVVRDGDQLITTKSDASKATNLEIEFKDGRMPLARSATATKTKKPSSTDDQGTLF